ncbi:MAG: endonuclease/exonuclease/phosphatase family protein [Flavobacteriales bacterium]
MARLSLFHKILLGLNFLFILGLGCSYLAPYISPADFWPLAFAGLGYPLLVIGNLLFVLYWILFKKRIFWISLIVLILGYPYHRDFFRIDLGSGPIEEGSPPLQVMSFNVRLFGFYKWNSNKARRDKILRFLQAEQPDIACFQEYFFSREKGFFDTRGPILERLNTEAHHQAFAHKAGDKHLFGIATFSSKPIVHKGRVAFPQGQKNICIYSDILLKGDTVRVYNAHLGSIRTRGDDLNSIKGWRSILGKLRGAFVRRAEQVDRIVEHMKNAPHPIILCGDLNDTPNSYAFHRFDAFLQDSFSKSGSGMGRTYIGELPSFRIDHIFHSKKLHSFGYEVMPEELSDHRPVQCKIQLKK